MTTSRNSPFLFNPKTHSSAVRFCRSIAPGVWLMNALHKLWVRKARRLVSIITASVMAIVLGEWPVQALAIIALLLTFLWVAALSDEACLCQ